MNYQTVHDIMKMVKSVHAVIGEYFDSCGVDQADERGRMLLQRLSVHEQNIVECLHQYDKESQQGILNTYIQFLPKDGLPKLRLNKDDPCQHGPDEVIAAVMEFDHELVEFYQQLAEQVSQPKLKELFTDLAQMETAKDQQFSMDMLTTDDM